MYSIGKIQRSLEGSVTMFLVGWLATLIPFILLPSSELGIGSAIGLSALAAFAATVVEAASPWGIDNLTVPAISALVLALV